MKRWQKALLFSVLWIVAILSIGFFVTDVMLAGKITPQQDEQISEKCGMAIGGGTVLIWVVVFSRKPSRPRQAESAFRRAEETSASRSDV